MSTNLGDIWGNLRAVSMFEGASRAHLVAVLEALGVPRLALHHGAPPMHDAPAPWLRSKRRKGRPPTTLPRAEIGASRG